MKMSIGALFIAVSLIPTLGKAQAKITIAAPVHGSSVVERPIVEGTVTDPAAAVWIVVHPLEVSEYWVQQRVSVGENGAWKAQINIGRPGRVDLGTGLISGRRAQSESRSSRGSCSGPVAGGCGYFQPHRSQEKIATVILALVIAQAMAGIALEVSVSFRS